MTGNDAPIQTATNFQSISIVPEPYLSPYFPAIQNLNPKQTMNEIVIDITKFSEEVQDFLKDRAVREGRPLKMLLAELIESTTQTILRAAGAEKGATV